MKNSNQKADGWSRRQFIGRTLALSAGMGLVANAGYGLPAYIKKMGKPNSLFNGVQIGCITYSFRSMPDQSAEATLKYVLDCGISAIELMGDPAESFAGAPKNPVDRGTFWRLSRKGQDGGQLSEEEKKSLEEMRTAMKSYGDSMAQWRATVSMDKFAKMKKMYADAGVSIYAFKPATFGSQNTDAEIDYGMRAAKTLGATHVTLEYPDNLEHTKRLSDIAAKHKMLVAYHGHEQQIPTLWDEALEQSKYNAMNLDAGHYVAAGNPSPLDLMVAKHDRIASMHIKDRQIAANGKGNLPWGTGDTPIVEMLQLMRDKKYKFPATVELEYQIPEGSDAVKEVTKCVEYCKKALKA